MERPLRISGVTSYSGTYAPITDFERMVLLKDNVKPFFIAPAIFDAVKANEIRLTFSEEITGTMVVKVTQTGIYNSEIGNFVTVSGNSVIITLTNIPVQNSYLRIDILENNITDLSGNQSVAMLPSYGVVAAY